jgi:superfamily II DNA/RNA helicase
VINYSAPNHLEAYVHRTSRKGRAGNRGVSYTCINATEEAKFAPVIARALIEAGQSENIDAALKQSTEPKQLEGNSDGAHTNPTAPTQLRRDRSNGDNSGEGSSDGDCSDGDSFDGDNSKATNATADEPMSQRRHV